MADRAAKTSLRYLSNKCAEWGGRIDVMEDGAWRDLFPRVRRYEHGGYLPGGLYESPFADGHGIHWDSKAILVAKSNVNVGSIIHEMGHTFLDSGNPENSQEWAWLGWEIRMARMARCYRTWSRQNSSYVVGDGTEWVALSTARRRELEAERVVHGQSIGIIDASGIPLPRR